MDETREAQPPASAPVGPPGRWRWPVLSARAKLTMAALLALALGWVGVIAYQYETSKRPLVELPAVAGGAGPAAALLSQQRPGPVREIYGPAETMLANPMGVAVAPSGDRIYVTESTGERTTRVFDRSGVPVGHLAPPNTGPGGRFPLYVAVDGGGMVYVSDRLRGVIDIYTPDGAYQGRFQPTGDTPVAPLALTFDRDGNFYVTDVPQGHHRLMVFDVAGQLKLTVGREGAGPGEFAFPNGVAVDAKGTIYVADSNNSRVQIFDREGGLVDTIGRGGKGNLGMPRGLAVDGAGRFFIVDTSGQVVDVWDITGPEPRHLFTVGSAGVGKGEFAYPNGIALDLAGRLYVTDRMNNRVTVWSF